MRRAIILAASAAAAAVWAPSALANSTPECTDQGAAIRMDTSSPVPVTRVYSIAVSGQEPFVGVITFSAPGVLTPAIALGQGSQTVSFSASLNGSDVPLPLGTLTCGTPALPDTPAPPAPPVTPSAPAPPVTPGTPVPLVHIRRPLTCRDLRLRHAGPRWYTRLGHYPDCMVPRRLVRRPHRIPAVTG